MSDPLALLRPRRRIAGISAILLPFDAAGAVDWPAFEAHVARTHAAGLTPAVNMDTGYVNLIDAALQDAVLDRARSVLGTAPFVAGAFVRDEPGAPFDGDAYVRRFDAIGRRGATPVVFQSHGLTRQADAEIVAAYERLATHCDAFIAFELGTMFAPFGAIYSLDVFEQIMAIPRCQGIKHSSLKRAREWQRLRLRDQRRPEFKIFTGNDLAIDMVMYGSDYLLGLSTFAPEAFALRDRYWLAGDERFYELNDLLQYLGFFAFRRPVPAYKHSAAQFLKLRGWLGCDATHPASPTRPDSDRAVLADVAERLAALLETGDAGSNRARPPIE